MITKKNVARNIAAVMAGLMLTLFISSLDNMIVSSAMPSIIKDLRGLNYYSLPFTAYLLFSAIVVPISGKLSDSFGRKKVLIIELVFFLIASALCGLSTNMIMLICFRGLQGAGGGVLAAGVFTITSEFFPVRERGKYIGILSSVFALASLLGPLVGGFITEYLSWRWIFFINAPIGLIALYFLQKYLPEMNHMDGSNKLDLKGILAFSVSVFTFVLGIAETGNSIRFGSPLMFGIFGFSVFTFYIFYRIEKNSSAPLLPQDLLRNRIFRISAICAFLTYFALFGIILYVPFLLQIVLKKGAAFTGMILLPMSLSMVAGGSSGGFIITKFQKYRLVGSVGYTLASLGLICIIICGVLIPFTLLAVCLILIGFGIGLNFPVYNLAPQAEIPVGLLGILISSIEFFQIMGGALSSSILGAALHVSLTIVVVACLAALLGAIIMMQLLDEKRISDGIAKNLAI